MRTDAKLRCRSARLCEVGAMCDAAIRKCDVVRYSVRCCDARSRYDVERDEVRCEVEIRGRTGRGTMRCDARFDVERGLYCAPPIPRQSARNTRTPRGLRTD